MMRFNSCSSLLKQYNPKLAEELVPNTIPLSVLLKVLQNLLIEGVPLRDMRTIAESIMGVQPKTQDQMILTAAVRTSLSRLIIQTLADGVEEIPVLTLEPKLEKMLMQTVQQSQQSGIKNEEALIYRAANGRTVAGFVAAVGIVARSYGKYSYLNCVSAYTSYVGAFYALWYGEYVSAFISRSARS